MSKRENVNILSARIIIQELHKCQINHFFVSPGSRSTLITLAIAELAEQDKIGVTMCPDERAAAYACLGYSKTGKVGALVCTSGTAVANYLPAIIEAYNSQVPMIVLTTDRPTELKDTQSNQTIDQHNIFGGYVNYFAELDCSDRYLKLEYLLTTVDNAVYKASVKNRAAVHINCCFREPLLDPMEYMGELSQNFKRRWASDEPYTKYLTSEYGESADFYNIYNLFEDGQKAIFVIGKLDSDNEAEMILDLAEQINIPVFADTLSQAKFGENGNIIYHYDTFIENINPKLKPDLIIHFGGRIVSKRLQKFIELSVEDNSANYVVLNNHSFRQDQAHIVSMRMSTDLCLLCEWLSEEDLSVDYSTYLKNFLKLSSKASKAIKKFSSSTDAINEINLPNLVLANVPESSNLYISNSMPLRDFDSFAFRPKREDYLNLKLSANRGASGIDGVIASAVGFGIGHQDLTTLIIGDLSALHDLNSLHLVANSPQKMIIIINNNNGGGIFNFLPINNHKNFEKYFATPLNISFKAGAEMFGLNYYNPKTQEEFKAEYKKALDAKGSSIIEIFADRDVNYLQHKEIIHNINNEEEIMKKK